MAEIIKKLTWVGLEEILRAMNKKGFINRQWVVEEEALVFIVKHLQGIYPNRITMINTFTKDCKVLEIRVTDNYTLSDRIRNAKTKKYTEQFQAYLDAYAEGVKSMTDKNIIETTNEYWDCECPDENYMYIHSAEEKSCPKCGAYRDSSPDARVSEVNKKFNI